MNQHDYDCLLAALNDAVAILARNRTPDPSSVAAYDTLKQARAMIVATVDPNRVTHATLEPELVAA